MESDNFNSDNFEPNNSEPDNSRLGSAKEPGRGYHDLGGLDGGPIDTGVSQAKPWEKLAVVVGNALGAKGAKIVRTDEVRRTREEMGAELYNTLGYFEKGIESLRRLLVEKGAKVANGMSDLFVEVFGDAGKHARSAVGWLH